MSKPMTNYNERLDEMLEQVAWYGSYKRSGDEPEGPTLSPADAKQSLTSLIKELVAEAKPKNNWLEGSDLFHGQDEGVGEFEQNLLKALEEV